MKTSKFFLSTLIAAAAMTAPAYATETQVTYTGGNGIEAGTYGNITLSEGITTGPTASSDKLISNINVGGNFWPGAYSLMFWVDFDSISNATTIFNYGGSGMTGSYGQNAFVLNTDGSITFGRGFNNGEFQDSLTFDAGLTGGEHHIALVNAGVSGATNTVYLYVDGVAVASASGSNAINLNMNNNTSDFNTDYDTLNTSAGISYGDARVYDSVKTQGTVIKLASGRGDDVVWGGSESGSWSGKNWVYNSETTFFGDDDNVTFNSTGTTTTISLANGESFNVGTMSVNADYTFSFGSEARSTSATISGTTLFVASGATMTLGEHESQNVNLSFDEIKLSGKIYFNNAETTWKSLEFVGEEEVGDTVRNLHIFDTKSTGLTIEKTIVTNNAQITAHWGGNVALGALTLNADLTLNASSQESVTYKISSITGTGGLSLVGSSMTVAFDSSGTIDAGSINANAFTGAYNIISGVVDASSADVTLFATDKSVWHRKADAVTVGSGAELKVNSLTYGASLGNLSHYADNRVLDGGKITITGTGEQQAFKVTTNGGTLESSNADASLAFKGDDNTNAIILGGALFIGGAGDIAISTTGTSAISGEGALQKFGTGTLTLSSSSDYSGGTTISAGTLVAGIDGALGDGAVEVSGGQLSISEGVAVSNSLKVVLAPAVYEVGSGKAAIIGSGEVAAGTSLEVCIDSTLLEAVWVGGITKQYQVFESASLLAGEITVSYTTDVDVSEDFWNSFSEAGGFCTLDQDTGVLTLGIPEPSAFGLLAGVGALALVVSRRRRNRR